MSGRMRIVGGPWPERIGAHGVAVPKLRDEYPWAGLGKNEVVVLLDDDPLVGPDEVCMCGLPMRPRDWTCVIDHRDVVEVAG